MNKTDKSSSLETIEKIKELEGKTLSIFCFDTVLVSETLIIELIIERIDVWKGTPNKIGTLVSVEEYRQILNDFTSPTELIEKRLQYLESFCRNIIRPELQKIYENN
ncbi:MAG: hypothetical protein WCO09_01005 [bacterium]